MAAYPSRKAPPPTSPILKFKNGGGKKTSEVRMHSSNPFSPLADILAFSQYAGGLRLRRYQRAVARAVIDSVMGRRGLALVVLFPRQSGKNELQAQLEAYLLVVLHRQPAELVKISPTFKPQTLNAMRCLERVLERNLVARLVGWQKEEGYLYRVGQARMIFLSGAEEA